MKTTVKNSLKLIPSAAATMRDFMEAHRLLLAFASALVLSTLLSLPLLAEEPYVQWVKTPAGSGYTGGGYLTSDANGGVIAWDQYGALVHLNARGGLVSSNTFSTGGRWLGGLDGAGNQYWSGYIGGQGFFVAKVSPTGQFVWIRNNQVPDVTEGDVSQWTSYSSGTARTDRFGNIAVAGISQGPFKLQSLEWDGERAPFVCKLDTNGNVLWGRKVNYQFTRGDWTYTVTTVNDVAMDHAGNVIVSGWLPVGVADFGGVTVYPGAIGGWKDHFLAKYGPNGELLWVTLDYGNYFAVDGQGEIYVGFARFSSHLEQWGLARLGPDGTVRWEKPMSPPFGLYENSIDYEFQVAVDPLGQPIIAGGFSGTLRLDDITVRSRTSDFSDFVVAKTDVEGHTLWAIAGGGSRQDRAGNLVCDAEGDIFIAGYYDTSATFDGWLIRGNWPTTYSIPFLAKISEKPPLALARTAQGVQLTWPAKATNYVLEASTSLPAVSWTAVTNPPTVIGRDRSLQLPATGNAQFFRLRQP